MRSYLLLIFSLTLLTYAGCNEGAVLSQEKKPEEDSGHSVNQVSQSVTPDTSFQLEIDGEQCILTLTRDEFPSAVDTNSQNITVRLITQKLHQEVFVETKEYNEIDGLKEVVKGCYRLTLVSNGGGSGYSGTVFQVRPMPQPGLQSILNFNELSTWRTSKDGNTIVAFQGIWNMSTDSENEVPESHFSEHRQAITLFTVHADTVIAKEIGVTEKKYDFYEDTTYSAFRKAEPKLAGKINWQEFD